MHSHDATIAYRRLWPELQRILAASERKDRSEGFERQMREHFERFFQGMLSLYGHRWDFYFHLQETVQLALHHWLHLPDYVYDVRVGTGAGAGDWFLDQNAVGATGYVDLFAGDLQGLKDKIPYLRKLGITYLHLMPLFDVPDGDSDGGYAIRDYGKVNPRLGSYDDLVQLARDLHQAGIKLVLDFVFNHTSDQHRWAMAAKAGDKQFQDYYFIFRDEAEKQQYDPYLREIFPDKRPGCFTYHDDLEAWVWTTFNSFQWDLNYQNPEVFTAMAGEMMKLISAGADVIRLDALAFTWKEPGTPCENLARAHTLIQTFNAFCQIAAPGVLFKSEAIVAPDDVNQYIASHECQLSYNPMFMALLWEALATRQTTLLSYATRTRTEIPAGTNWVNYLRCHDDIGWCFADDDAWHQGINPYDHRQFLNAFYTNRFPGSFATGVPFQENPKTGDCRISGTLASLAGLQTALQEGDEVGVDHAIKRILLLHGVMLAFKGVPLFYLGDELAMLNDYTYLNDEQKAGDSRWIHRVAFSDKSAQSRLDPDSISGRVYLHLQRMVELRQGLPEIGRGAIAIEPDVHPHLFVFRRVRDGQSLLVVANFSEHIIPLSRAHITQLGQADTVRDLLGESQLDTRSGLQVAPYQLLWLK